MRPPIDLDTVPQPFAPHLHVIAPAPGHPLVDAKHIGLAPLLREHFVVREKGSDTWQSMRQGFGGDFGDMRIAMEIASPETFKPAVSAGMGASFLPAHTISRELKAGRLRVLDVQAFPPALNGYHLHRRNQRLPPVAPAFKDFLLCDAAALIAMVVPLDPSLQRNWPGRPKVSWPRISSR